LCQLWVDGRAAVVPGHLLLALLEHEEGDGILTCAGTGKAAVEAAVEAAQAR